MKSITFDPLDEIKKLLEYTSKEISESSVSNDKQIHSIRVMSKKLRSFLYLIKPFFNDKKILKSQNQFYKELAKDISQERETKVMYDTFRWLMKKSKLSGDSFMEIQTILKQNIENNAVANADIDKKLQISKQSIMMGLNTVNEQKRKKYTIKDLKTGFLKTYNKAYDTMHHALETKEIEDIHLFRKYAKYHMYQIQLLSDQLKCSKKRVKNLDKLTYLLGKSHDLALFAEYLHNNKNLTDWDILMSYISKEQKKLVKKALKIAKKTFTHKRKKFKIFKNIDN